MIASRRRFLGCLVGSLWSFAPAALIAAEAAKSSPAHSVAVGATRAAAVYARGETVEFAVRIAHEGRPVSAGEVEWTVSKDGVPPMKSGRATVKDGMATIPGSLDEPGFLQCRVTFQPAGGGAKITALGGAAIAPKEIKPSLPVPDDFDAFWSAQKARLAAVPINARLTPVKSTSARAEAFDLQADSVGSPVSGYFARPVGAKPRSHPAILTVHGAGVRSAGLAGAVGWAAEGALALDINAHGLPNGRESAFYSALADGELKDYRRAGRESRDTIYFLGMFLRLIRAIDFLTAQAEWDGRTVVVSGSSQGGAQALAAAGLDPRVTFFAAGVAAMCDHTGPLAGRVAGWPKFIESAVRPPPAAVVAAVRYYDGVNFAARARTPGIFTVGFIDTTCPPTSVYAAYNALAAPKEIFHDIEAGHTNTPAATAAMREAVRRHLRR